MIAFDELIAPLSREAFIRDYWCKSFLRLPGASGRFASLFSWDELDSVLESHRLSPPRVKLFQNDREVDPTRYVMGWHMGAPRLDAGGLAVCVAEGASLILNDVHETSSRLRCLMDEFQSALHIHAYANLYAAWHSHKAFGLHWDAQESFVLQLSGHKRWKVYPPTRPHPLENDVDKSAEPTGEPVWEGVMKEGDVLYMPRGWWHLVLPLNEPSLHLTVSLIPPKKIDFLEWAVAKLRGQAEIREDLPVLNGIEAQRESLARMAELLHGALTGEALSEFLSRWNANISPRPHIRLRQAAYEQFASLNDDSRVRLAGIYSLPLIPVGDHFEFHAAGRLWSVPSFMMAPLSRLRNDSDCCVAELCATLTDAAEKADFLKSVAVLARAGIVLVEA